MTNIAIGIFALWYLTTGDHNIAVGAAAGRSMTTESCNIIIGNSLDIPAPGTSFYINVRGVVYPSVARYEPWFQDMARRTAHEVVDAGVMVGSREYLTEMKIDMTAAHQALDAISFDFDACRAPVT